MNSPTLELGVFLDRLTMRPSDLDFSRLTAALPRWQFYDHTPSTMLSQRLAEATVVVANKSILHAEVLEQARNLRLVCIAATGVNNVDLDAARRLGLVVCNIRAYGTPSVVQHVFALVLALTTRLLQYHEDMKTGCWPSSTTFSMLDHPITELSGKALGIIGYGELGRAVGRLAEAFGMRVLVAERVGATVRAGRLPFEQVLRQADVLTLHSPLTPETRGLIGPRELSLLKPSALLINTARGGIVDVQALVEALCTGRLAGAGVDVLTEEPPRPDHPLLNAGIPNLIVTPHIAWASRESRQRAIDQVAENIEAFRAGTPNNRVV